MNAKLINKFENEYKTGVDIHEYTYEDKTNRLKTYLRIIYISLRLPSELDSNNCFIT